MQEKLHGIGSHRGLLDITEIKGKIELKLFALKNFIRQIDISL